MNTNEKLSPPSFINLHKGNISDKKQEIKDYFNYNYSLYESLFDCLKDEQSYYVKPNSLRHPLVFYFAHTAVFFINKLKVMNLIHETIDTHIESTTAVGVDEMSWDDLDTENYQWPSIQEIRTYRKKAKSLIINFIDNCTAQLPINSEHPLWIIMMGIEHEKIHLETSSVLIRELDLKYVNSEIDSWNNVYPDSSKAPQNKLLDVPHSINKIGANEDYPYYFWDNESGYKLLEPQEFKASQYLVSNHQFLEFIECDGYSKDIYWTEEGLAWLRFSKQKMPKFWRYQDGSYNLRLMLKEISLPLDWPAEVNYHEAKAFCSWLSEKEKKLIRLPSEDQWYQIRNLINEDLPTWKKAPGNINLEYFQSPTPVNLFKDHQGFYDIIGNVWQWTETHFSSFQNFKVHKAYDDFSLPTFDGKHNLIKGGSWISTGNLSMKQSRYAFRKHFQQHSGFRYVEAQEYVNPEVKVYESSPELVSKIDFNYGNLSNDYHLKRIDFLSSQLSNRSKALVIGSSSGRMSFELSKFFSSTTGIVDSVNSLIAPTQLQTEGSTFYTLIRDHELINKLEINVQDYNFDDSFKNVKFFQTNLNNLLLKDKDYDFIFIDHCLRKINDIKVFFEKISKSLKNGGVIAISTNYQFKDKIGGFKDLRGEDYTSKNALHELFKESFNLKAIKENLESKRRINFSSYQLDFNDLQIWEKK